MRMMTSEDAGLTARALLVVLLAAAIIVGLAFASVNKAGAGERSRGTVMLPHPAGCPAKRFCGCGAAVEIFGKPIRSLWQARSWFQFPRARPAPGMVAVRRSHVMVLRQHVRGNVWLTIDHNSGRNRSRLHQRSIAGFVIVNPHATDVAQQ